MGRSVDAAKRGGARPRPEATEACHVIDAGAVARDTMSLIHWTLSGWEDVRKKKPDVRWAPAAGFPFGYHLEPGYGQFQAQNNAFMEPAKAIRWSSGPDFLKYRQCERETLDSCLTWSGYTCSQC